MDDTVNALCILIERLATETNRSTSTISRLSTGSGATYARLRALDKDGRPRHRITTERATRAMKRLSEIWPTYLRWPSNIARPGTIDRGAA